MFIVPAGMGVQEAGLIAFGALLGVSGPAAVALSLAKRMREILFGLPALLGCVDGINVKLVKCGGIRGALAMSSPAAKVSARKIESKHPASAFWARSI